jgi:hypothetical protein
MTHRHTPTTLLRANGRHLLHTLLLLTASASGQAQTTDAAPRDPWAWMQGTTWYVPARSLLALNFSADGEVLERSVDQTVWAITGTTGGYFWGRAVAVVRTGSITSPALCQSLIGSVTPEGRVHLTFVPVQPRPGEEIIRATGDMRLVRGRWTVEPQMSSGPGVSRQVAHWAYMTQCTQADPACQSLPGLGLPIETLLATCPGGPTLAP